MFNKSISQILILLAILVLIAVGFTIFSKNKSAAPLNEVSQSGEENMNQEKIVRSPAVAGAFYTANKKELETSINNFLDKAKKEAAAGVLKILIVPHAGHTFSGQVAAYAFKQLENQGFKRAILIGPSHNFPLSGLFLSGATHWQTPLGLIKVADINKDLAKEDNFEINDQVHQPEHSLEVEIPFLQIASPEIEIIPIIVGQLNSKQQAEFAQVLGRYLDNQTVLIVSVDLSHYHPYEEAKTLDNQSIAHILNLDNAGIFTDEIDAPWAVATILALAKDNGWPPKLLNYANSGDVTGDKSQVVGYSSFAFYSTKEEQIDEYTEAEKQELLKVARETLEMYLKTGKTLEPQTDNPKFKENRGVFVTLKKHGELRGCIGYIEPIKSLIEAVRDNAISAAVDDRRFLPVTAEELDEIEIEISILTLPQPDTIENIIKGKKGVVLRQGNRGATYLPQVWEDLPDSEQFFQSLCEKGGLPASCYQDSNTQISSYEAIVFEE